MSAFSQESIEEQALAEFRKACRNHYTEDAARMGGAEALLADAEECEEAARALLESGPGVAAELVGAAPDVELLANRARVRAEEARKVAAMSAVQIARRAEKLVGERRRFVNLVSVGRSASGARR